MFRRGLLLPLLAAALLGCARLELAAAREYRYSSYAEIVDRVLTMEASFPNLVEVFTAQDRWGVPSAGSCGSGPCLNHVVRLGNRAIQNEDTPEVMLSGALHGNERVGQGTLVELLQFMLEQYGKNPWITKLVDTRSVYMIPMTNSQGYYRNRREESGYDPNRDFPSDSPQRGCMNTAAARTVNELSREHLFQITVSYHGGIQLIGYMWGATSQARQTISPDDIAMRSLGSIFSATAGQYLEGLYPHGRINDILYSVRGAFEVWGYAGEEYPNPSGPCRGTGTGLPAYPASRTLYEDPELSQINILIETSRAKTPSSSTLGSDDDVLRVEGAGDGNFPRNMRIALSAIDMLEPYLEWAGATVQDSGGSAPTTISVRPGDALPALEYEVGGAVYVDSTFAIMGRIPSGADMSKPGFGFSPSQLRSLGLTTSSSYTRSTSFDGLTRWGGGGLFGSGASAGDKNVAITAGETTLVKDRMLHSRDINPFIAAWRAELTAPTTPGEYFVMVTARVDPDWADRTNPAAEPKFPFSHLVHARTNDAYDVNLNGHRIQGRTFWYSVPIRVVVTASAPPAPAPTPACRDASPSNVELRGRIAPCDELAPYCADFDFVRAACPVTCNACASAPTDPSPPGQRPSCTDVGGLLNDDGSPATCFEARGLCDTFAFVKERCASTCGFCNSMMRCTDVPNAELRLHSDPGRAPQSCTELRTECATAAVQASCPMTCNVCRAATVGFQLSPIVPVLYEPGSVPSPPPSTFPPFTIPPSTSPPVVAPTTPTPAPVDNQNCGCRNGSGRFDRCQFYQPLSANVCLISWSGNANQSPPCPAPPGGSFRYSNNYNAWYSVNICEPDAQARQGELQAGQSLEDAPPASPAVYMGAGVAIGLLSAVGAAVVGKSVTRSSRGGAARGLVADNPRLEQADGSSGTPSKEALGSML